MVNRIEKETAMKSKAFKILIILFFCGVPMFSYAVDQTAMNLYFFNKTDSDLELNINKINSAGICAVYCPDDNESDWRGYGSHSFILPAQSTSRIWFAVRGCMYSQNGKLYGLQISSPEPNVGLQVAFTVRYEHHFGAVRDDIGVPDFPEDSQNKYFNVSINHNGMVNDTDSQKITITSTGAPLPAQMVQR
jgi:hypothetical protein